MYSYLALFRAQPHFLLFGVLLAASASFGQTWFIALYSADIRGHFGLSHGDFGAIYSLATLLSGASLAWVGRLVDHISLRRFCTYVLFGLALSAGVLALGASVVWLGVAIFGLRLCGQGLLTHIATTSMARFFERNRGKAISISALGFPLAESVLPVSVVTISALLEWREAWTLWALVTVCILLPVTLALLKASRPLWTKRMGPAPGTTQPRSVDGGAGAAHDENSPQHRRRPERSWTRGEVLRDRRFHLVLPYLLAPAFLSTGVMFHQVHLVESKGWPLQLFAAGFVAYGFAKVIGSLIGGPLVDRYSARRLFAFFMLPLTVGLVLLAYFPQPVVAVVYLGLAGISAGLGAPIGGAFWAELYGPAHLGAIRAVAVSIMVIGSALSPAVFGWLFDYGVHISSVLYGSSALAVIASVMAAVAMHRRFPASSRT